MDPLEKKQRFFDSVHQALGEGPRILEIMILVLVFVFAFLFGSGFTYFWARRNRIRRDFTYLWRYVLGHQEGIQRRVDASYPIVVIFPNTGRPAERCTTVNISVGGMFLKMVSPFEVNSSFHFNMHLEDEIVISGVALVRWANQESNDLYPRGIGVEFITISDKDRNLIRKYLKKRKSK